MIDYNDMEQLAYQILSQDTSNSHLAREFYQNKFKEILIDEYQDINALSLEVIICICHIERDAVFSKRLHNI